MAQTDEERQASNVDALTAPGQATPGAAVPHRRPVLDSGATIHLFSDGCLLRNIRYLPSPKVIRVADGRPVYAYVVGDIDREDIKLKNVYVATDLKMDLVSVRELAKAGITTIFYKDHAELLKGAEVVGGAIAKGDTSLYELTYLWAAGDGDDTRPAAPSGSERWMMATVNGTYLPHHEEMGDVISRADDFLLPKKYFAADDFAVDYGYQKFTELMSGFKSLDDTVKPEYIQYSTLLSKFYQSDKAGVVDYGYQKFTELMSGFKSLDDTVKPEYIQYSNLPSKFYQSDKAGAVDYGYQKFTELMSGFKSLDDTVKPEYIQYSTLPSEFYQSDKADGGIYCNNKSKDGSVHIKAHLGPNPDGMNEVDFMKSLKD